MEGESKQRQAGLPRRCVRALQRVADVAERQKIALWAALISDCDSEDPRLTSHKHLTGATSHESHRFRRSLMLRGSPCMSTSSRSISIVVGTSVMNSRTRSDEPRSKVAMPSEVSAMTDGRTTSRRRAEEGLYLRLSGTAARHGLDTVS